MAFHGPGRGRGRRRHSDSRDDEQKPKIKITDKRMLAWFARYLLPHWPKLLVGTVAMIISTVASMAPPYILGKGVIDKVIVGQDSSLLMQYIVIMAAAFFGENLFNAIRMAVMHILGQRFVYDLRAELYQHVQRLSLSYFETTQTGDVMSRISNDVDAVEDMVVHGTDTVFRDALQILLVIGVLFWMRPELALIALAPVPIFVTAMIIFARVIRPIFRRVRDDLGEINARLQERIGGIQVIKAFAREEHEYKHFDEASFAYYRNRVRTIWLWTTFFPAVNFVVSCGVLLVTWRGAVLAGSISDPATAGDIVVFIGYLQGFYWRFGALIQVYNLYNRALASVSRIFELMDEEPEVTDAPDAIEAGRLEGQVELRDVSFRYRTGEMVLEHVSVVAKPGETVALVGRSGAGKTSLVNLIPRFYDPVEGAVLIDDTDVRTLTQKSLRANIGMVLQETFLFIGTVKENVRYGRLEATDEEIIEACRAAHAHEFIEKLPEKYDTEIGERGVKLSGGQKQRLAIARAILADPRILILDEATSLVDTEAEQIIQKALENLMSGRTTFVIAHRLSTIRNADKIVVIDQGEVIEQADHTTLMGLNGLYARMYEQQFRYQQTGVPMEGELFGP
ncbi:MAG: ABC transporter ATP-binding protein [candidate division WS1 bacterium]|jgi:subfamily B ATP-binding cassette protein MsbA|nr:ABC transporter ATP-binding protein [candidate division WS1 bacterium]